jgi:hypothetical protein
VVVIAEGGLVIEDYENLSNEELGRLVRQSLKGREQAARENARTKSGFSRFLEAVGLAGLATAVYILAVGAWHALRAMLFGF